MEKLITRPKIPRLIENKINAVKCNNCGNIRYPARSYCNKCQGTNFSNILIGPKGVILTYSSSYQKKKRDKQQIFGLVKLLSDDGKDSFNLMGTFDTENFDEVKIGKEVELLPNEKTTFFKLVGD
jgi:uncharacterized OB-fold protein